MVYKKYVYKRGRKHGPYYYHSYRQGDSVKKVYIGGKKEYKEWLKNRAGKGSGERSKRDAKRNDRKQSRTTTQFIFSRTKSKWLFIVPIFILLIVTGFFLYQQQITGKVSLNIKDSYTAGENIKGTLKLSLKKGELLPIDSKLVIRQGEISSEIPLNQFIYANSNGSFYVENTELSGMGQGYGFQGEKVTYPLVFFIIEVYDLGEAAEEEVGGGGEEVTESEEPSEPVEPKEEIIEEIPEEPEEESEEPVEPKEEIIEEIPEEPTGPVKEEPTEIPEEVQPTEQTEQEVAEETVPETSESNSESGITSEQASEPAAEPENSLITAEVVKENTEIIEIKGGCSKNNPFTYAIETGKTAKIKKGSVETEIITENGELKREKLGDDLVTLQISENEIQVLTDYSITEKGFGQDYLKNEEEYVEIDLEELGIKAEQGVLTISLVYDDITLSEVSEKVTVHPEKELEKNVTEIENISIVNETLINVTEINITKMNLTISNETELNITTKQYKAIIGKPVKWLKRIKINKTELENLTLELPKQAENITIKTGQEVLDAEKEIEKYEEIINKTNRKNLITGQVTGEVSLEIEKEKGFLTRFWEWLTDITITGKVIGEKEMQERITETPDSKIVDLTEILNQTAEGETEIGIEYYTEAPKAEETRILGGKRVTISAADELNYTDILAYTLLDNRISINETDKIKIYWVKEELGEQTKEPAQLITNSMQQTSPTTAFTINNRVLGSNINEQEASQTMTIKTTKELVNFTAYDLDEDNKIDYVEWIIPHLSNQTYEIIYITKAEHLDENRTLVEDIYEYVKEQDDNWTEIPVEHYVRVTFEIPLDNTRDITIYARSADNSSAEIEVYTLDSNELVAIFKNITEEGWYKVYLTNLSENESYDVFDLRVISNSAGVEFDYIVDPTITSGEAATDSNLIDVIAETGEMNFTHLNISTTAPYDSLTAYWSFDGDKKGTGGTAYDLTENNRDGTFTGGSIAANCVFGGCAQFTEDDSDGIDIPDYDINPNENFTVTFWFKKVEADQEVTNYLFSRIGTNHVFYIYLHNGDYLYSRWHNSSGNLQATATASSYQGLLDETGWYHVAIGYNGSTFLYLDNVFEDGDSILGGINTGSGNIDIGKTWLGSSELNGSIDEVMIFSTALTAAQISDIYNNQSARFKATGKQELNNQSVLSISSGNNRVNVTTYFEANFNSEFNLSVGYFDGSWSITDPQTLTSGSVHPFNISSTTTNLTLNYTFIAGNQTNPFYTPILNGSIDFVVWNEITDSEYPVFSSYWDNNASLTDSGTASFNVTITSTNGTVFLEINGANYTANNVTADVYNASVVFSTGSAGTYTYYWHSWGNGTEENYNNSGERSYTINKETTVPAVYLKAPPNGSTETSATVYFAANYTDNAALKNATLYVWNSTSDIVNSTESSTITGTSNTTNISIILPYEDTYTWNYYICDNSDNCAWNSSNWTVTYATAKIDLNIITPADTSIGQNVSRNVFFNVSVNVTCRNLNCGEINVSLDPEESGIFLKTTQETKEEIITTHSKIKVGEPVRWKKSVRLEKTADSLEVKIPEQAKNINVERIQENEGGRVSITGDVVVEGHKSPISSFLRKIFSTITGRVVEEKEAKIIIKDNGTKYEIEYETPAPKVKEKETEKGKKIVVSAPDELNYKNVLAYTKIDNSMNIKDEKEMKLYWHTGEEKQRVVFDAYDTDDDGNIDYIEWTVPHLSEQTYEIIYITKAEHLDENRTFVEDIYDDVREKDDNWTAIPVGHYVRVTFEILLDNTGDITIYARSADNSSAEIEVYTLDSNELVAIFKNITEEGWYKVYLTNLSENESYDVFDLRVISNSAGVEFDYIVDPTITSGEAATDSNLIDVIAETGEMNFTHLKISATAPYDSLILYWSFDSDKQNTPGFTAYDLTEYNNDGEGIGNPSDPIGDAFVNSTGAYGAGVHLDGFEDFVNAPSSASLNSIGSNLTISLWYYTAEAQADIPSSFRYLFRMWASGTDNVRLFWGATSGLRFYNDIDDVNDNDQLEALTLESNKWVHLLFSIEDSTLSAYRNGVLNDTETIANTFDNLDDGFNFTLGMPFWDELNRGWNGSMDEIMIFNTSLTAAQAADIYKNQSARFKTTGKQELNNQSVLSISSGNNRVNVTTYFEANFNSEFNLSVGYFDGSWSITDPQTLTSGSVHIFNTSSTTTNLTLNYTFIAGNQTDPFYTPILNGSIDFVVWNEITNIAPTINNVTTIPNQVGLNSNVTCQADINDSDGDDIVWANFTIKNGDGDIIVNNVNGTVNGNLWNSSYFIANSTGTWNCSITAYDGTDTSINSTTFTVGNKGGLISTTTGATPFYTNESNPRNISLNAGESQVVTFWVNATGPLSSTWEFFVYVNQTSNMSISNITDTWNVTISNFGPSVTSTPQLTPVSPETSDDLNCSFTITDPDAGDTLTVNITWYKNNVSDYSVSAMPVSDGVLASTILDSGNTSFGETWICEVQPYDGSEFGTAKNSTETAIVDADEPGISFTTPTPDDGATISNTSLEINVSIVEENGLDEVIYNWNGTNYTIFNDSVILFMNFDNRSALGENDAQVVDLSGYENNGTVTGAVVSTTDCKYGNCFSFDGDGDYIEVTPTIITNTPVSVSVWFKANQLASDFGSYETMVVQRIGADPYQNYLFIIHNANDKVSVNVKNTSGDRKQIFSDSIIEVGKWTHAVNVINSSNDSMLYINGIKQAEVVNIDDLYAASDVLRIGSRTSTANEFNGTIDDVMIFNRSLSQDEVYQLYVSNLYKFNQSNWVLYVNQSKNSTDGLDETNYTYFASAKDDSGNENVTETRTVIIDSTYPTLNITYPLNTTYTTSSLALNYTYSESNCDSVWYNNGTDNSSRQNCGVNWTGITVGNGGHTWTLYINDSANNQNSSNVTFSISTTNIWTCNTNELFNNASCWSLGTVPVASNEVIFNGSGTGDVNITNNTMPQDLESFTVEDSYTGDIYFSPLFAVGDWTGNNDGTQEWNVTNNINISNGTMYVYGDAYNSSLLGWTGLTGMNNITDEGHGQIWNSISGNISVGKSAVLDGVGLGFDRYARPNGAVASHGGLRYGRATNDYYGNTTGPTSLGSSGAESPYYQDGGSAIKLKSSDLLVVNGIINMSGEYGRAAGSGGSIWLDADNISGIGIVRADGADSDFSNGAGGGRIRFDFNSLSYTGIVSVAGGKENDANVQNGRPGTFSFTNDTYPSDWTLNGSIGLAGGNYTIQGNLVIPNETVLGVHAVNNTASDNGQGVVINVQGNITIEANASIDGDVEGFYSGYGPGYSGGVGGTHGGRGGGNSDAVYGSETKPLSLGSSAVQSPYKAYGGGAVKLNATGYILLDGKITVKGQNGRPAGAGGSIWLVANNISGNGEMNASGGTRTLASEEGGGGGRIALTSTNVIDFSGIIGNLGGNGSTPGGGGTVYINATTSIISSGNISVVGYNGTTGSTDWGQRINFTSALLTLSGIYNASRINSSIAGTVDGTNTVTYTDCSSSFTGTFNPDPIYSTSCELTVNIETPANNSRFNISSVAFNVSLNRIGSWCGLSIDGDANVTMGKFNDTWFNYTNSSIADGSHSFVVSCNDTGNNIGVSDTYYFYVDTIYPNISYGAGTTGNATTQQGTSIYVNVSAADERSNISTFIDFDNSLVGWWRMDDLNSSGDVVDYIGKNNGSAVGDASQTDSGYFGKGFDFDSDGDYVSVGGDGSITPLKNISVSFWMKSIETTTTSDWNGIIEGPNGSGYSNSWRLLDYNNYVRLQINLGASTPVDIRNTSDYFSVNEWHHVVWTYDGDTIRLYRNGLQKQYVANESNINYDTNVDPMLIGSAQNEFNGTIDDVMIFNRTLTAAEIQALYANKSSEYLTVNYTGLTTDRNYTFKAYTQDKAGNVNSTAQRTVRINQIPTVSLSSPANDNLTTNRTPTFSWSGSDSGGGPEPLEYEINITCWESGSIVTAGSEYVDKDTLGSATSYTPSNYLKCLSDNNQIYNWTVRAWDGVNYSDWATERNLSIQSSITLSLPTNNINFGALNTSDFDNTTDDSPAPFILSNDGNAEANVSVNFTDLWDSESNPSAYYQYKIRDSGGGCFMTTGTQTTWANAPSITTLAINRLNFTSGYQTGCSNASIDIHVESPVDEEPGNKSSIVTFTSSLGEEKVS